MKVQIGGLAGLRRIVFPAQPEQQVRNIYGLIQAALRRFGSLYNLPYGEINRSVTQFRLRQRRRSEKSR